MGGRPRKAKRACGDSGGKARPGRRGTGSQPTSTRPPPPGTRPAQHSCSTRISRRRSSMSATDMESVRQRTPPGVSKVVSRRLVLPNSGGRPRTARAGGRRSGAGLPVERARKTAGLSKRGSRASRSDRPWRPGGRPQSRSGRSRRSADRLGESDGVRRVGTVVHASLNPARFGPGGGSPLAGTFGRSRTHRSEDLRPRAREGDSDESTRDHDGEPRHLLPESTGRSRRALMEQHDCGALRSSKAMRHLSGW